MELIKISKPILEKTEQKPLLHWLCEADNCHGIKCVSLMIDIAPSGFGTCIGQDEFMMKSSLSEEGWILNLVQYRCSSKSVMRLLREFYEFIAAKMPRKLPQYL